MKRLREDSADESPPPIAASPTTAAPAVAATHTLLARSRTSPMADLLHFAAHLLAAKGETRREVWSYDHGLDDHEPHLMYRPPPGSYDVPFGEHSVRMQVRYYDTQIVGGCDGPAIYYDAMFSACDLLAQDGSVATSGGAVLDRFSRAAYDHAHPRSDLRRMVIRRYATGSYWQTFARQKRRPIESIFLPDDTVQSMVRDMREFLRKETEADYREWGRPYKRVYLLEGPPGLGKTSLVMALAAEFGFDVALYPSDKYANDHSLSMAVNEVDNNSILLIEDVESLLDPDAKKCTLSGMTTVLDGPAHRDRMIVMCTTNHADTLSPVLTRPGRVDKTIRFLMPDEALLRRIVAHRFPAQPDATIQRAAHSMRCRNLSTAAVVEFLFEHRHESNIADAVAQNIDAYLARLRTPKTESSSRLYS